MILLDSGFMKNEFDFVPMVNTNALYKDYYYKICQYIYRNNIDGLTPEMVDNYVETGLNCFVNCKEERIYLFKRAMGLQIIYDTNNGRQEMIRNTDGKFDICRETRDLLDMLGLIKKFGVLS